MHLVRLSLAAALLLAAPAALAHTGSHPVEGFVSGFSHPFAGMDHLLAMVAVGLWAVLTVPRRVWPLPLAFMAMMTIGASLGAAGLPLAGTETAVAASVLLLGALLSAMARLPQGHAVALVGLFALFHGHAHGAEMAAGTAYVDYAAGFVAATGLLHGVGIVLGRVLLLAPNLYRGTGILIGAWGAVLLAGTP